MIAREAVVDILKQCYDPEIPIDLWNLGLIYDIRIDDSDNGQSDVHIVMSLTTPGCSMGGHMSEDIRTKLQGLDGVGEVSVQVTFEPAWNPEMMTDEAREKLGFGPKPSEPLDSSNQPVNVNWE